MQAHLAFDDEKFAIALFSSDLVSENVSELVSALPSFGTPVNDHAKSIVRSCIESYVNDAYISRAHHHVHRLPMMIFEICT